MPALPDFAVNAAAAASAVVLMPVGTAFVHAVFTAALEERRSIEDILFPGQFS